MAISITHAFVSGKADPPDASLVKPSDWNASHVLSMGTGKLVGRTTASSGAAEEITVSGALTFSAQTLSLPTGAITNAYLNDMATQTIKGRTSTGTGDPEDLTVAQVTAMLDTFSTSLKGLVPASGGGTTNFLRADGSWAAPPTANAQTLLDTLSTTRGAMVYRGTGGWTGLSPNTAGYLLKDGGAGADPSFASISSIIDGIGNTRGQILYRGASGWAALSPGTAGTALVSGGAGADPSYGVTPSPLPKSGTGVGQWYAFPNTPDAAAVLPAGGTWAWVVFIVATATGIISSGTGAGISSGGTTVGGAFAGYYYMGFAWRIA